MNTYTERRAGRPHKDPSTGIIQGKWTSKDDMRYIATVEAILYEGGMLSLEETHTLADFQSQYGITRRTARRNLRNLASVKFGNDTYDIPEIRKKMFGKDATYLDRRREVHEVMCDSGLEAATMSVMEETFPNGFLGLRGKTHQISIKNESDKLLAIVDFAIPLENIENPSLKQELTPQELARLPKIGFVIPEAGGIHYVRIIPFRPTLDDSQNEQESRKPLILVDFHPYIIHQSLKADALEVYKNERGKLEKVKVSGGSVFDAMVKGFGLYQYQMNRAEKMLQDPSLKEYYIIYFVIEKIIEPGRLLSNDGVVTLHDFIQLLYPGRTETEIEFMKKFTIHRLSIERDHIQRLATLHGPSEA